MARARERIRHTYASHPMLENKVHTGTEVERSAYCAQHERTSIDFQGVNANGWIFRCKGERGEPDTRHLFVAEPGE